MKIQFRMNFRFTGPWPNEKEKRDWQSRFITSVSAAWSNRFSLEPEARCHATCPRVTPFVEVYAPHTAPHVNVDVQYTTAWITSRAGGGVAHLDSLDLTPTQKGSLTDAERTKGGVRPQVPAVHEFGHLVGRPDVYSGTRICAPGYPLSGIMCFGNEVTTADYEPFANALQEITSCPYRVVPRK